MFYALFKYYNLCSLGSWLLFQKEKFVFVCDWCVSGKEEPQELTGFSLYLSSRKLGLKVNKMTGGAQAGVIWTSGKCI